jgi:hypothetical protein
MNCKLLPLRLLLLLGLAGCHQEDPVLAAAKAAWKGDAAALERALSRGVSPDATEAPNAAEGGRPLILIAFEGPGGIVSAEILLRHGADINAMGAIQRTALMEAAEGPVLERVEYLLRHGADPNIEDSEGQTALFYLNSDNGNGNGGYALGIARMLVMAGADPCHKNKVGKPPEWREQAPLSVAGQYLADACHRKNE